MTTRTPAATRESRGRLGTLLLAGLLATGCARTPAPALYLLDLPAATALVGTEQGLAVGLGPIEFPRYLDRPQIITRGGDNRLDASEANLWAEPVKDSAARVLVASVAAALTSNRVYLLPRRQRSVLDWRVTLDVDRFDGALGGVAVLGARWSLYRGDQQAATLTRVSLVEEPLADAGYPALVAAQTRALDRLGREIAAAINVAAD